LTDLTSVLQDVQAACDAQLHRSVLHTLDHYDPVLQDRAVILFRQALSYVGDGQGGRDCSVNGGSDARAEGRFT
jgi:hypothetical protein